MPLGLARRPTMYRRSDPRWNRTIQHLASNIESANESAQANLWTFAHDYISPCLSSVGNCLHQCTAPCFPSREDRLRRSRRRSRGRAELSFDFYDDWEYDETDGLLGWGNDELDRLLAGSSNYGGISQPSRQRTMSYSARRDRDGLFAPGRRKSAVQPHDGRPDPTVIPSSSYFGFLGRLPFKLGGKVLRYKPSAADLTEHPGASRTTRQREEPLLEDSEEERTQANERKGVGRNRSHTTGSGHTTDSLSSRGDLFPSEDEADAVPIGDEFTMVLERRSTGDEVSSGKTRSDTKRASHSRRSTRTASSRNTNDSDRIVEGSVTKGLTHPNIEEVPALSTTRSTIDRKHAEELEIEGNSPQPQLSDTKVGQPIRASTNEVRLSSPRASQLYTGMDPIRDSAPPLPNSPTVEISPRTDIVPFPAFDPQTAPESGSFTVDDSEVSSYAPTPNRPSSLKEEQIGVPQDPAFVPARLPHFDASPG